MPETRTWTIFKTKSDVDDIRVRYDVNRDPNVPPRKAVLFLNGRGEWIEKYNFLPERLMLPADTIFVAMDHRGQGGSGGQRASVNDYQDFVDDVVKVINLAIGELPYVILAHSMGGLITLHGTLTGHLAPKAIALSAPLILMRESPLKRVYAKPISKALCALGLGGLYSWFDLYNKPSFEENDATHSRELYEIKLKTPYPIPGPTFQWVAASFDAMRVIHRARLLKAFLTPTLVMGSEIDGTVDPEGFRAWVRRCRKTSKAKVRLEMFCQAFHELFFEAPTYSNRAIALTREWIGEFLRS